MGTKKAKVISKSSNVILKDRTGTLTIQLNKINNLTSINNQARLYSSSSLEEKGLHHINELDKNIAQHLTDQDLR